MDKYQYEKKTFFDLIGDKWMTEDEINNLVSPKIGLARTKFLFDVFRKKGDKYLEEDKENKYHITDRGNEYYEFLKDLAEKVDLEKRVLRSNINMKGWTIANIVIALLLSSATTTVVVCNRLDAKRKEVQEGSKVSQDSARQYELLQSVKELKEELQGISLSLKDTSIKKVRIEK